VATILRLVTSLETDLTLLLTGFGLVSHLAAYVALDCGTSVAPMPGLLAAEAVVLGAVLGVVGVNFVADLAFGF
jgi:hypothetical protein